MIDFFLILFFSKTVLLTPNFVDISGNMGEYELYLDEPISAITQGASIQVDVWEMLSVNDDKDVIQIRDAISNRFPDGSIEGTLFGDDKEVRVLFRGGVLVSKDSARLVLSSDKMPTSVDFSKVFVRSSIELERVRIYWKNYKK